MAVVWPFIQIGINNFGLDCDFGMQTLRTNCHHLSGTLECLLYHSGLHHMLTIPINYTDLGGVYQILFQTRLGMSAVKNSLC